MNSVAKITSVSIRDAFRHEANNFTVWLEDNIDALAERLGMDLAVVEREKSVGSFKVDLLCEDQNGNHIIVENQLEKTDHDHLGKLLTYLINLDAVEVFRNVGNLQETDTWPQLQEQLIHAMFRLDKVFRPRVRILRV